jgi:hypothetical protein
MGLAIILVGHGVLTVFMFLKLSHRSIGPMTAFKNFVNSLKDNPNASFRLREGDFHQELEDRAKEIKELLQR